ncbi:MAG: hypothetical protein RML93_13325 [Anaerolineales bacterium]|nr:hypothetical protein [Anaerolineales bacterium]MDW8448254.1 hypothetical protein [Anaerolineales bacterium]
MKKRTIGLIATIGTALSCGCPGLFACIFGAASALGGGTFSLGEQSGNIPRSLGVPILCLGLLLMAIPVAVGFFTLRSKPQPSASDEPIPPSV